MIPQPTPEFDHRQTNGGDTGDSLPGRRHRRAGALVAAAALAATGLAACGDDGDGASDEADDAHGEEGEAEDTTAGLDTSVQQFEPTDDGLILRQTAHDPADTAQVDLVEEHLREEADRFTGGDYSHEGHAHSEDTAGLAELEAGADDVTVTFEEIAGGAMLTFTAEDPGLVEALHTWADAQTEDHGEHEH